MNFMSANNWEDACQMVCKNSGEGLKIALAGLLGTIVLFALVIETFHDHSYQLLLSSYIQLLALAIMAREIRATRSVHGLSLEMMMCYVAAVVARFASIGFEDHYMPGDKDVEHFAYLVLELATLGTAVYVIYMVGMYMQTYEQEIDRTKMYYLAVPAFLFALVFGPSWNESAFCNTAWTFALYLECMAGLPQLMMFKMAKKPVPFVAKFLFTIAIAKAISFGFWAWYLYEYGVWSCVYICGAQAVQLLWMGEFIHKYVASCMRQMQLPLLLTESV